MRYTFHPSAKTELNHAVEYYESCKPGLGSEFLEEIYSTILQIQRFPFSWKLLTRRARRCLTRRFPYSVIYQIKDNQSIIIIAVAHSHRSPNYWVERLTGLE